MCENMVSRLSRQRAPSRTSYPLHFPIPIIREENNVSLLTDSALMENCWWSRIWSKPVQFELLAQGLQPTKKDDAMKTKKTIEKRDELRPEYDFDFSKADRGRYARRIQVEGSNLVLVEPDLAKSFPDSASVNAALRSVVEFANLSAGLTRRSSARTAKRRTA